MPDLDDLDNFSEGMHVNPLPASDVRRRGDRMRRRNTALATVGGVVAAAVFIGTPVALLSGDDQDTVEPAPSPPTPTVTEDTQFQGLTEIPADFPLATGFPETNGLDGSPTQVVDSPGPQYDGIGACQTGVIPDGQVDTAGITYTGESEDHASRTLVLLEDEASAAGYLDDVRKLIQQCPTAPMDNGEDIYESALVDLDLGTEGSVVVAQQVRADDGLLSQLTVTEFAQSGNALFVEQSYGSAGGQEAVELETARLKERSAVPLGAMCLFSAEPCTISRGQGEDPAPDAPSSDSAANPAIPSDFPLDANLVEDPDGLFEGPSATTEGVAPLDVCGSTVIPLEGVERMAVIASGLEYSYRRELTTFASTEQATNAVDSVRQTVGACPEMPGGTASETQVFSVLDGDTGYDSVTFGRTYGEGLGGDVHQVTRVGNAVLVTVSTGEMSVETIQDAANLVTEDTRDVTDAMCLWTEAGC